MEEISLTDEDRSGLLELALESGKSPEALIHEAIQGLIGRSRQARSWRDELRAGEGLWAGRTDLPSLDGLRAEWDRRAG